MNAPTQLTPAAGRFRVVVVAGSVVLFVSVFLPWCTVYGFTYTFFGVDGWQAIPVTELVVCAGGAAAAMCRLRQIKLIGLFVGSSALALNMVGSVAAARLADVHNADPYFRIRAVISVRPAWGGWIALLACIVVIVGALSRWPVSLTLHALAVDADGTTSAEDVTDRREPPAAGGHPDEATADDGPRLPHLDDVLAPPSRRDR